MGIAHRQGGLHFGSTPNSVVLGSTPLQGSIILLSAAPLTGATISSVQDANGNVFTPTPASPLSTAFGGFIVTYYLLSAPANISKTITVTVTGSATLFDVWVDEFTVSGGSMSFDKEATGTSTATGANITTPPNATPTVAASNLMWAIGWDGDGSVTNPTAGQVVSGWTGAAGGLGSEGAGCEYRINASGATNIAFTTNGSGDRYTADLAVFSLIAGSQDVITEQLNFKLGIN